MLIEFRVENHRSLRDEQAFTLEAANLGDAKDEVPREVAGHKKKLLPVAAIYGANASGKSNVLSALAFMREAVISSQRSWEPEILIPRNPFAWGEKQSEPSLFEITFLLNSVKHQYGFVLDDFSVLEEWLYAWPEGRKQTWFERERDAYTFPSLSESKNKVIQELTRPDSLFLSCAAQHNHERLTPLYAWFRRILPVNLLHGYDLKHKAYLIRVMRTEFERHLSQFSADSEQLLPKLRSLLKNADFGICDVKFSEEGTPSQIGRNRRFLLKHAVDDEFSWLDLADESSGTQTLFRIAPELFDVLETGGILLVDELEDSLHPLLGLAIVNMFNSPELNPHNAQLLFTTHDTNLLGTALGEPVFRRDQVWFTEKDQSGATTLYPLTDYKPRKAENLERGYLQGRYGAIPFLGNLNKIME